MSEDKSATSFYISEQNQEWLEQRPASRSEIVNDLLDTARTSEWNGKPLHDEVQIESVKAEIKGIRAEYEAKQELLEKIKELQSERSPDETYTDRLVSLLESIEAEGTHIWPEHNTVDELAIQEQKPPAEVIEDAKRIAADRNMDILNTQFVRAGQAQYMEEKPIAEEYDE